MTRSLPVSVCLLTLNEAENLVRTLPPLESFAEILVFDSGSTDSTVAMCEAAGAVVHRVAWEGFGTTRRKLFEKASQPWILWLDADEVISAPLLEEITELFAGEPEKRAWEINRMVFMEGRWIRHGEWFPDWVMRLFPADRWEMVERDVHERVRVSGPTGRLRHLIEHHSFRDWADLEKRSGKYAKLWAQEKRKSGKTPPSKAMIEARATLRFMTGYLLRGGFLDGVHGYRIAKSRAREVRIKYGFWREGTRH